MTPDSNRHDTFTNRQPLPRLPLRSRRSLLSRFPHGPLLYLPLHIAYLRDLLFYHPSLICAPYHIPLSLVLYPFYMAYIVCGFSVIIYTLVRRNNSCYEAATVPINEVNRATGSVGPPTRSSMRRRVELMILGLIELRRATLSRRQYGREKEEQIPTLHRPTQRTGQADRRRHALGRRSK